MYITKKTPKHKNYPAFQITLKYTASSNNVLKIGPCSQMLFCTWKWPEVSFLYRFPQTKKSVYVFRVQETKSTLKPGLPLKPLINLSRYKSHNHNFIISLLLHYLCYISDMISFTMKISFFPKYFPSLSLLFNQERYICSEWL